MILPTKHISRSESLLGLGAVLVKYLGKDSMTIDELWYKFSKVNNSNAFPAYHGFDHVVLAISFLFLLEHVDIDDQGKLFLCD